MKKANYSLSIVQLTSYKKWVIDGLLRESLTASGKAGRFFYLPDSKKYLLKDCSWVRNNRIKNSETLVFGGHKSFLAARAKYGRFKSHIRLFFTQVSPSEESIMAKNLNLLQEVDRYVVQSSFAKEKLIELGISPMKVIVNPGAIDRSIFYPCRTRQEIADYIFVSGDFKYRKNPELLISVMNALPGQKFKVHGNNLSLFEGKVNSNVELLEFNRVKHPELMREATLYLMLSKTEGGPMGVMEALASGTPCLTTDVGFCRDLVKENCGQVIGADPELHDVLKVIGDLKELKQSVFQSDLLNGRYSLPELGRDFYQ